jgi:pyruvate ferredoxin oxidoreductase beta subunit
MATQIKALREIPREELFAPGHRMCAGCGVPQLVRTALKAVPGPKVVVTATGCLEVATTIFPYTSWRVPWVITRSRTPRRQRLALKLRLGHWRRNAA